MEATPGRSMPTSGREQGELRRPPLNRAACLLVRPILIRPRGHAGGGRRSSGGRGARLCETLGARLPLVDIVFAVADGAVFRSNSETAAFVRLPGPHHVRETRRGQKRRRVDPHSRGREAARKGRSGTKATWLDRTTYLVNPPDRKLRRWRPKGGRSPPLE